MVMVFRCGCFAAVVSGGWIDDELVQALRHGRVTYAKRFGVPHDMHPVSLVMHDGMERGHVEMLVLFWWG